MNNNEIVIDPEFKNQIWPQTAEEHAALEGSMLAEGCRDPLVIWGNVLIDGHHRYAVCLKHGIPFQTVSRDFPDREAVAAWIDANQVSRRNLTTEQMSLIRGRMYNRLKGNQGGDKKSKCHDVTLIDAAEVTANLHNVSTRTVKRDAKYAERHAALTETGLTPAQASQQLKAEDKAARAAAKSVTVPAMQPEPPQTVTPGTELDGPVRDTGSVTISKDEYDEMLFMLEDYGSQKKEIAAVLEADDKLAEAVRQIDMLTAQVNVLNTQLNGERNKTNHFIKEMKYWRKVAEKREREIEDYKLDAVGIGNTRQQAQPDEATAIDPPFDCEGEPEFFTEEELLSCM